jgi:AcrR family transcriptional regulator
MIATIKINIPEKIYKRDPELTQLGKKIISQGIRLIDELGFEEFTFKKLAHQINSTEASIYRYFENKHNLLVYLASWYWSWLEYQIDYLTQNIESPAKRLQIAIRVVVEGMQKETKVSHIHESALYRIVLTELPKAYHTKTVDIQNQNKFFFSYKSLCKKISAIMLEVNPQYPYSHTLSSTILESAHQQVYFAQHLPSLTEIKIQNDDLSQLIQYLTHLAFGQLYAAVQLKID